MVRMLIFVAFLLGSTWFVSPTGNNSNPCARLLPCSSISYILQSHFLSGDSVSLSSGVFTGFNNTAGVNITGLEITILGSSSLSLPTVIDCQGLFRGWSFFSSTVVFSSVLFQNCVTNNSIGGSALTLQQTQATIQNCQFVNNRGDSGSEGLGRVDGAVSIQFDNYSDGNNNNPSGADSHPFAVNITGCLFANNVVSGVNSSTGVSSTFSSSSNGNGGGGALSIYQSQQAGQISIANCQFWNNSVVNTAYGGGAVMVVADSNLTFAFTNTSFSGNYATGSSLYSGGAVSIAGNNSPVPSSSSSSPTSSFLITNCVFTDNFCHANSSAVGCDGGALIVQSLEVYIEGSTFHNNSATGNGGALSVVSSAGTVISNSVFSSNLAVIGGAVSLQDLSNAMLQNCQFYANKADGSPNSYAQGGALYVNQDPSGSITLLECTFSYNTAGNVDAQYGYYVFPYSGGAVSLVSYLVEIIGCSFFQNQAAQFGGALYINLDTYLIVSTSIRIYDSQFYGNSLFFNARCKLSACGGGALYVYGSIQTQNCLFQENTALFDLSAYTPGTLSTLVSLGGGAVMLASSPSPLSFEIAKSSFTNCQFVNNLATTGILSAGGGAVMLNGLVNGATFSSCLFQNNAVIYSPNSVNNLGGGGAIMTIQSSVISVLMSTFSGNTADGLGAGAVFMSAGTTQLSGSSFSGNVFINNLAQTGGALCIQGQGTLVTFSNNTFSGNKAVSIGASLTACGGAVVLIESAAVEMVQSTFTGNSAIYGGAVCLNSARISIASSIMNDNVASRDGGAVYVLYSYGVILTNVTFSQNHAVSYGGAISTVAVAGIFTIQSSLFEGSSASLGGSIYLFSAGILSITSSQFVNCSASNGGGAIGVSGTLNLDSCSISNCSAAVLGGGLYIEGSVTATSCYFSGNVAADGGSIATATTGQLVATSSLFEFDSASSGASIYAVDSSIAQMNNCTVSNAASTFGAIFVNDNAELVIDSGSMLKQNSGSALVQAGFSNVSVSDSVFLRNSASYGAAVNIESQTSLSKFVNVLFDSNTASGGGGAIYYPGLGTVSLPACIDCQFVDNIAPYGPTFATQACYLQLTKSNSSVLNSVDTFQIAVFDCYNDIVTVPQTPIEIYANVTVANCGVNLSPGLLQNGLAVFEMAIPGHVGSVASVVFTSPTLPQTTPVSVTVKGCGIGESLSDTGCNFCAECGTGRFNTNSTSQCYDCPAGTSCRAHYVWSLEKNFVLYDPVNQTMIGYECDTDTCLAYCANATTSVRDGVCPLNLDPPQYLITNTNLGANVTGEIPYWQEGLNQCAQKWTGFMCSQCIANHSVWSGNCADCSSPRHGLLALYVMFNWVYVGVIHVGLTGSSGSSALPAILIDFYQTAQLILPAHYANVVGDFAQFLNLNLPSGGSCLYSRTFFGAFLQQLLVPIISYVQLAILVISIWVYHCLVPHSDFSRARYITRPLVSLSMSVYTPITGAVLGMLRFRSIGGYQVLTLSPAIWVWNAENVMSAVFRPYFITSIALVIAVSAGIPLLLSAFVTHLYRRNLWETSGVVDNFGLLYHVYRPNVRGWGIIVLLRRTLLTALLAVPGLYTRSLVLAGICIALLILELLSQPFAMGLDNIGGNLALASVTFIALLSAGISMPFSDASIDILHILLDVIIVGTIVAIVILLIVAMRLRIVDVLLRVKSLALKLRAKLRGEVYVEENAKSIELQESLLQTEKVEKGDTENDTL